MNTSATRDHLRTRLSRNLYQRAIAISDSQLQPLRREATRLERAITYLTGRCYCRACGNPDCPNVRAHRAHPLRDCPAKVIRLRPDVGKCFY